MWVLFIQKTIPGGIASHPLDSTWPLAAFRTLDKFYGRTFTSSPINIAKIGVQMLTPVSLWALPDAWMGF